MTAVQKVWSSNLQISQEDFQFHPHSFADFDGRLFTLRGGLYRGIRKESSAFFKQLFESGLIDRLVGRGLLIESEITPWSSDEYELIVRHKQLPFNSYPNEWCAPMLKDAGLTILDLLIELHAQGLTLKDGHPWNVLFDGYRPVYVDLTSIVPSIEHAWPALDEFSRFCVYPLFVMASGHERIARCLLSEYEGVRRAEALALSLRLGVPPGFLLSRLMRRSARAIMRLNKKRSRSENLISSLKDLRSDIQSLKLEPYRKPAAEVSPADSHNEKIFSEINTRLQPASVMVVGGNAALQARTIASKGCNVVSLETDPARAAGLYYEACERSLPVLSLVMDFVRPTPSIGFSNHYSIAAHERLSCDLVWAPSLVDELTSEKYLRFETIAEGLSLFTRRWLVAGFLTSDHHAPRPSWYTQTHFIEALEEYFNIVERIAIDSDSRVLFLCEKKQKI